MIKIIKYAAGLSIRFTAWSLCFPLIATERGRKTLLASVREALNGEKTSAYVQDLIARLGSTDPDPLFDEEVGRFLEALEADGSTETRDVPLAGNKPVQPLVVDDVKRSPIHDAIDRLNRAGDDTVLLVHGQEDDGFGGREPRIVDVEEGSESSLEVPEGVVLPLSRPEVERRADGTRVVILGRGERGIKRYDLDELAAACEDDDTPPDAA